jgi:adenylyl-sulfate kinase
MTANFQINQSSNVVWHEGKVSIKDRCSLLNQLPKTIWFTGLSASGKSTLAFALERHLIDFKHLCFVLDGDNIRHGLNKDLLFSDKDRTENIRRVAEVAKLLNEAGLIVITAFISPSRNDRELAKKIIGEDRFFEIYVSTPLEICEARDPKGMYKKARDGNIKDFTGVNSQYEPPIHSFLEIDTSTNNELECVRVVVSKILQNDIVKFYE